MKIIIIKAVILIVNCLFTIGERLRHVFTFFLNNFFEKPILEEKKFKKYKILPFLHHRTKDYYPYPIHDWKDETFYLKSRSTKEWAWEFLRRNKNYQYDYDRCKLKGHFPEFNRINPKHITLEFQKKITERFNESGSSSGEIEFINNQIFDYYARSIEQKDDTTVSLYEAIHEKYGLSFIGHHSDLDPRFEISEIGFFSAKTEFIDQKYYDSVLSKQKSLAPISPEHFVMRFNAKEDISSQISIAKKSLDMLREKHGKNHEGKLTAEKNYIKYIRVLDAISAGMNLDDDYKEIMKVVDPETWDVWIANQTSTYPKNYVDGWITSAKELSNTKYLTLLNKKLLI
ncbi:DUF6499 domain-containing protein [uncultured Cocleimonas sp.]|uniref:transcriptional regulator domain-containing protein n=1 Tax=uncultured Cocleimonas sp. TaxID=1051587 RepID=UPI0026223E3B|nr:DUF6499 domain-containing protein [uncultured Cocleimonas sp.]